MFFSLFVGMKNKKGFELAVSTLVLIILGMAVLIGLLLALNYGFQKFREAREPILGAGTVTELKAACDLACKSENKLIYCCHDFQLDKEDLRCNDPRLEIGCSLDCSGFECGK